MKHLLLVPFIILAVIFGFYGGIAYKDKHVQNAIRADSQSSQATVALMLDFGDGKIKTYDNIIINGRATVFSVMQKISEENSLDLEYKDYGNDMGAFIEAIDGYNNNFQEDKHWQFWVNNKYSKIGAGSYKLGGGEVVEWKYVKGQVN